MVFIVDNIETVEKQKGRRCPPPGVPVMETRMQHAVSGTVEKLNKMCLDLLYSVRPSQLCLQIPRLFSSN